MKIKSSMVVIAGVMVLGIVFQPGEAKGRQKGKTTVSAVPSLTTEERDGLLYMREEEKLAHDVYITFYEQWGTPVFANIARSEQRHTDRILALLNTYGIEDPVQTFGIFQDPDLQALYDTLVAQGSSSELAALYVGALIEEVDMVDIVEKMEVSDQANILRTYTNLLSGSENHLNAFVRLIEAQTGELYVAQFLPQDEVDRILGQ